MGTAASTAYSLGKETASEPSAGAGLAGVARAAGNAAKARASDALGVGDAASRGRTAAWNALNEQRGGHKDQEAGSANAPDWARSMRAEQSARHHRQTAAHALQQGERGGASATPDIKERDDL
jgi:type IV secretion system protein TrbL